MQKTSSLAAPPPLIGEKIYGLFKCLSSKPTLCYYMTWWECTAWSSLAASPPLLWEDLQPLQMYGSFGRQRKLDLVLSSPFLLTWFSFPVSICCSSLDPKSFSTSHQQSQRKLSCCFGSCCEWPPVAHCRCMWQSMKVGTYLAKQNRVAHQLVFWQLKAPFLLSHSRVLYQGELQND